MLSLSHFVYENIHHLIIKLSFLQYLSLFLLRVIQSLGLHRVSDENYEFLLEIILCEIKF